MAGNVWHILESSHKSWNIMNTSMIKEVVYMEFHQDGRSSTQTSTSTCPTMWIEVARLNIVVHRLITGHWCIPLTDTRSPIDNENGNQGTRVQSNKCEYMSWGLTLGRIHRSGDIDVFPKFSMVRKPTTDDCKSQGTQMNLDSYSKINDLKSMEWKPLEGGN